MISTLGKLRISSFTRLSPYALVHKPRVGIGALTFIALAVAFLGNDPVASARANATAPPGFDGGVYGEVISGTLSSASHLRTPAVTVTASASDADPSTLLIFKAEVTGSGVTPTGKVTFHDGAHKIGAITLKAGVATFSTKLLLPGTHSISAAYAGDSNYSAAVSKAISVIVRKTATIQLAVTAAGKPVNSVSSGTPVLLTASVKAGGDPVTTGQVEFCDASAKSCSDIHLQGIAQLTKAGTAELKIRPAIGSHRYKAVFLRTKHDTGRSSGISPLSVTGAFSSATTIAQSGSAGNYTLVATVSSSARALPGPTGNVSFTDTSNGNALLATAVLGSATAAPAFVNVSNTEVSSESGGIVAADFNRDGNLDIAIQTNEAAPTVAILLGDGTGKFTEVKKSPIKAKGTPVLVQDFNGDGIPDLLLAGQSGPASINVLLGNGDGSFREGPGGQIFDNFGDNPVVSADFNGDGIPDLALAGGYYLVILLGKGDGSFSKVPVGPTSISEADLFNSMAAADFNGDGIQDLAVADSSDGVVSIYLGKGDGTFRKAGEDIKLNGANHLAVGDFNGDGKLDLAVPAGNKVHILFGKGDGTFKTGPTAPLSLGSPPFLVSVGDFNGDGIADLFLGAQVNGTSVNVLLGKGDGTFSQMNTSSAGLPCCSSAFTGDFNNDGLTDIASSSFYDGTASVLLTQFIHASATAAGILVNGPAPHAVAASFPGDSRFGQSTSTTTSLTSVVAPPVISPPAGVYTAVQSVSITDATPGATIYYEATGSTLTDGYVKYTGPIEVSGEGNTAIAAYATATGYQGSGYVFDTLTLNLPQAPAPVISLAPGEYSGAQMVTISDSVQNASIYYTTNGSLPTTSSAQYSGPITIASSVTLVATAIGYGYSMSAPAVAQYIITSAATPLIYTIAGSGTYGYSGDGGAATLAVLNQPEGSAMSPAGDLYLADNSNHRIRKVSGTTGAITTIAGTGIGGYSGDNGAATAAELYYPHSVAFDSAGNLYISDAGNSVIRMISATTGKISTFAGNGKFGNSGDGGAAIDAEFGNPTGLAFDSAGNLYVSDSLYSVVRKISTTGTITAFAGSGRAGYSGDNGPATSAELNNPSGIAADSKGNLYIADFYNNVIRKVAAGSGTITTVAGNGYGASQYHGGFSGDGGPATAAELYWPYAVAVDSAGNLYIDDQLNWNIRKVTASSGIINTVAGNGTECNSVSGDGGPATSDALCYPLGVSVDAAGNIYISDSDRVRKVMSGNPPSAATDAPQFSVPEGSYGVPQTVTISDDTPGASIYITMDGKPVTTASTGYQGPIAVTGTVNIQAVAVAPGFLASPAVTTSYTITSPPTAVISTVAGNGSSGYGGDGGLATSASIGIPTAVALDSKGNFYISDAENEVIRKVSATTGVITTVAGSGIPGYSGDGGPATGAELSYPIGLAIDSSGNLYIAEYWNCVIRKVTASTGIISTVAGKYGSCSYSGDGVAATAASLRYPEGVALDSVGNLYIADTQNNLVREVSAATGLISTIAGVPNGLGSTGDGGPATKALLNFPSALAFDGSGNLFIADTQNYRVREVEASTGIITTVVGNGDSGTTGDGGLALNAQIVDGSLALDASGDIYLGGGVYKVREISASTGMISSVAGNGIFGFSGDGGSATVAEMGTAQGVVVDAQGNLYIADQGNNRIRKVTFAASGKGAANLGAGSAVDGVRGGSSCRVQSSTTICRCQGCARPSNVGTLRKRRSRP